MTRQPARKPIPQPVAKDASAPILAPAQPIPCTPEELALACAPMSTAGDPELTEARVAARDTLEAWGARMRGVCKHCGLRGKCAGCAEKETK